MVFCQEEKQEPFLENWGGNSQFHMPVITTKAMPGFISVKKRIIQAQGYPQSPDPALKFQRDISLEFKALQAMESRWATLNDLIPGRFPGKSHFHALPEAAVPSVLAGKSFFERKSLKTSSVRCRRERCGKGASRVSSHIPRTL